MFWWRNSCGKDRAQVFRDTTQSAHARSTVGALLAQGRGAVGALSAHARSTVGARSAQGRGAVGAHTCICRVTEYKDDFHRPNLSLV